jgi:hypothetical protein
LLYSLLNGNLNTFLSCVATHQNIFTAAIREVLGSGSNIKAVAGGSESNIATGDYNTTSHTSADPSLTQIFQPGSQNLLGGLGGPGGSGDPDPNKRGQLPTPGHYIEVPYLGKVKANNRNSSNLTPEKRAERNKRKAEARKRVRENNRLRGIEIANSELANIRTE